jgi:hypothetical protein
MEGEGPLKWEEKLLLMKSRLQLYNDKWEDQRRSGNL